MENQDKFIDRENSGKLLTEDTVTKKVFKLSQDSMKSLFKLLLRKELFSNYIDRPILTQYKTFKNEVLELEEELSDPINNKDKIQKELSDVIYTLFMNINNLVKEWVVDEQWLQNFGQEQSDKIYQRSPFLKENRKPTEEEEEKIWYETKAALKKAEELNK